MSRRTDETAAHRTASRFQAGVPAVVTVAGQSYTCDAHNLSRTGALLTGDLPRVDGRIELSISTAAGDREVTLTGTVRRHAAATGDEPAQLGVEFTDLDDATNDALDVAIARVVEGFTPGPLRALGPNPTPDAIRAALEKISLVHRMNLAARGAIAERELMLHDPNLRVIDAVARNPQLTLPEARALIRRRPLLPSTIDHFARTRRWTADPRLAIDIAAHPSAPLQTAESLVRAMTPVQRRELLERSGVHPVLREKLLQKKI